MIVDRDQLKGLAAVLMGVAAIVTSVAAYTRKEEEPGARAGYGELTAALLAVQATERQNHDDLVALHTFVEEYTKSHEAIITQVPIAGPPPSGAAPTPPAGPTVPSHPGAPAVGQVSRVLSMAPAHAPAPPVVHPLPPPPAAPRAFDAL